MLLDVIDHLRKTIETTESARLDSSQTMEVQNMKTNLAVKNASSDNILYCLLYLDGLIMINIDLIKKIDEAGGLNGKPLADLLNDVLITRFLDDYSKEVASHILSAALSFVRPDTEPLQKSIDLIGWTYDYYQTT